MGSNRSNCIGPFIVASLLFPSLTTRLLKLECVTLLIPDPATQRMAECLQIYGKMLVEVSPPDITLVEGKKINGLFYSNRQSFDGSPSHTHENISMVVFDMTVDLFFSQVSEASSRCLQNCPFCFAEDTDPMAILEFAVPLSKRGFPPVPDP